MTPTQKRAVADFLREQFGVAQRRTAALLGCSRSTLRYHRTAREEEAALVEEIRELARRNPRYGFRRVHAMLWRDGWSVNLKRVHRLWLALGLRRPARLRKAKKLGPKQGTSANSCTNRPARFKNDVWTCDFIADRTAEGKPLKWLSLVDEHTRECLALVVGESLKGKDVRRTLSRVVGGRGAPRRIRSDNGGEFLCEALAGWLPGEGLEAIPVAPASPWENGFVESFHCRLRDEFLERTEFESVEDAREQGAGWRREYNRHRPHSSLGYQTLKEFSASCDKGQKRR